VSDSTLTAGSLARAGFSSPDAALPVLRRLPSSLREGLVTCFSRAAEPDLALWSLTRLVESERPGRSTTGDGDMSDALLDRLSWADSHEGTFPEQLVRLLGASATLGDFLVANPGTWQLLDSPDQHVNVAEWLTNARSTLQASVEGALPAEFGSTGRSPQDALRLAYRGLLAQLAARDLAGDAAYVEVAAALSDLAVAVLDAGIDIARHDLGARADGVELGVVAMGKCGGHELNYVSDVDVVFVSGQGEAGSRASTAVATQMMRAVSAQTAAGTIWQVDAALRPEGKNGPLVRTLDSFRNYYERWAKTWEFQAMLKARPAAGDLALGRGLVEAIGPMVWQAADRPGFVEDAQAMRRRVIEHLGDDPEREIKLGPGGLRDVEFAVQLLQLVHGRTDESLRSPTTLTALDALTDGGYIGRDDGASLAEAYRFLRALEHRLQLYRLQRTHVLPSDEVSLRRIGRSMGFFDSPVEQLAQVWTTTALTVRRLHEKLFYRPLLAAVARIPGEESRLTAEAAEQRLTALGFGDPKAAVRHIQALTDGVSRRSMIQRQLLPAMLSWFADSPNPDAGLLAFRSLSQTLGSTPWYLRLLRDEGVAAQRMATVLASSRYATAMLDRAPEAVQMLGERDLVRVEPAAVLDRMRAGASRQSDPQAAVATVRAVRRRHLLAIAIADLTERAPLERVAGGLTTLADATVCAALEIAVRTVAERRDQPPPGELSVIAMGRFGGAEMGYGSDADVLFVSRPNSPELQSANAEWSLAVASELRRLLTLPMADPPLLIDADLRPEGRNGPLVRTLDSYAAYYARWSMAWEAQALLRARPVDPTSKLAADFIELIEPLRYPAAGLSARDVQEIRRIKARIDNERLPRGADRTTHMKLGRGGLADIEWTVQLLQMQHAHAVPGLRTTSTLAALAVAVEAGLVSRADRDVLERAWRLAARTRNAIMLVRARPSDTMPPDAREMAAVAHLLGVDGAAPFVENYRRITRQAHAVVGRIFFAG